MNLSAILIPLLLSSLLFFQGCSELDPSHDNGLTLCSEPRPEVCTQDYTPVCGRLNNAEQRTYSNACMACSEAEVVGYLQGECQ
jgi:hypothetical protein